MRQDILIGIDIGGTFTDFVIFHPESGRIETFKLLSTPHNPAEAVLEGLEQIKVFSKPDNNSSRVNIIHGSTVATNALLERKGARTALISTQGFRDVLQIGRQNRPLLYDLKANLPSPLVPENLRMEVKERVDHNGEILTPLDPSTLDELIPQLQSNEVTSVAVCLLFSFLRPEHEEIITQKLRTAGFFVSPSCEILPEFREYERMSTTVVNAYVSPVLDRYLAHLENSFSTGKGNLAHLRVMQSNGGNISPEEARRNGVRCILSGPAGGIIGARYVGEMAWNSDDQRVKLITFDMGGTSTDVSLIDGAPQVTTESLVGGHPIRIPALDIHTIGAGGGSIASIDLGGALRVGPESAGADPGPACYGKGDLATVTDANLVLGRLAPEYFLGGLMPLDTSRAWKALASLGETIGLDPIQTALGVVEIANAHMERALRVISVERGHDPRQFTLLSFGGAGGLHATDLARRLGVKRVLIPPLASTLSAFGMLAANVIKDYTRTIMLNGDVPNHVIEEVLAPLVQRGVSEVLAENITKENIVVDRLLDIRYKGQSYELIVPWEHAEENIPAKFHELHRQTYGYARPEAQLEIVNVRVRVTGKVTPPPILPQPSVDSDPTPAYLGHRKVTFSEGQKDTPFYRGESLKPGNILVGPAVVVRDDTTVLIGSSDGVRVDAFGNLLADIGYAQRSV